MANSRQASKVNASDAWAVITLLLSASPVAAAAQGIKPLSAVCTRTRQPAAGRPPVPNLSGTGTSSFPPLPQVTKVRDGVTTFVISSSTRDMDRELARLSTSAVVAWIGKDRPHVSLATVSVRDAFCSEFGVRPEDIKVAKHFPEDFFIEFEHRHHRDAAIGRTQELQLRQPQLPCASVACSFQNTGRPKRAHPPHPHLP